MKYLWILLSLLIPMHAMADADLDKVLHCMRTNSPPSVRVQQVELTTTDRSGGKRTLKGRLFAKSDKTPAGNRTRALLKLDDPPEYAGAAYLLVEGANEAQNSVYVYLPAVGTARRLTGALADSPLLGSNFSYNDFRQLQTAFFNSEALLEDPEPVNARPAYVVSFSPPAEAHSRYSLMRVWVDQQACVPVKTEFREGLNLIKELTVPAQALKKVASNWYASEAHMRDLQDGTSSVLRVTGTALGAAIPPSYFDPATFYLEK